MPVASSEYARMGATGFVASVMTAPFESMLHIASEIVDAAHDLEEDEPRGARCLGIHFEGPFLNPKFRGVHRAEWLLPASASRAKEMVDACKGACLLVTMAPEIDGAADAMRVFLQHGVVCSAGHTSSRYGDGHARDRSRLSLAHPRVQRHAAAHPSRSLDSRGLHPRSPHDGASHRRRLSRRAGHGRHSLSHASAIASCSQPT